MESNERGENKVGEGYRAPLEGGVAAMGGIVAALPLLSSSRRRRRRRRRRLAAASRVLRHHKNKELGKFVRTNTKKVSTTKKNGNLFYILHVTIFINFYLIELLLLLLFKLIFLQKL